MPLENARLDFLKTTSWGLAGATGLTQIPFVHAAESPGEMAIKIGLIGCGGRGTGAVLDAVGAATKVIYPARGYHAEDVAEGAQAERPNIQVVALADLFENRLARFTWLSGDHIVEQHVHNLDIMNWVLGAHPIKEAIEWDAAMQSTTRLGPERYEFGPYPIPPVALPGIYRFS